MSALLPSSLWAPRHLYGAVPQPFPLLNALSRTPTNRLPPVPSHRGFGLRRGGITYILKKLWINN
jgi:hypothetical protein